MFGLITLTILFLRLATVIAANLYWMNFDCHSLKDTTREPLTLVSLIASVIFAAFKSKTGTFRFRRTFEGLS